ncbi:hypothetical protein Y032_0113g373 [Ancylostoma ceylanicum]|nr:hypothetical protein Y032_0113g373 [Ancylostoma ceylanicum]
MAVLTSSEMNGRQKGSSWQVSRGRYQSGYLLGLLHSYILNAFVSEKTNKTKSSKGSPFTYIKTVMEKLDAMDETMKIAALGGGCLFLLLLLYCIYRMCCASGPSIEEEAEYLRRVKKATSRPPSPRKADAHISGSASRDSRDSRPTTPVASSEGRRSPPRARTPSRQRTDEWDPARRDPKMKNERTTQEDQPTVDFETERGHRRRLDKATRRLKRLLRLTREETKQAGARPAEDVQANILDAMGSVESPGMGFTAPTATGGSAAIAGTGGPGGGYEQVVPFMPETQKTEDAPKW